MDSTHQWQVILTDQSFQVMTESLLDAAGEMNRTEPFRPCRHFKLRLTSEQLDSSRSKTLTGNEDWKFKLKKKLNLYLAAVLLKNSENIF